MAITYGFYNSNNGDRVYDAEQFSSIFDGLITDGIYRSWGDAFRVRTGSNPLTAIVGSGRAWLKHTWTYNDSDLVLSFDTASAVYDRIDAIVIRVDKTNRANSIRVVKGTPAANPVAPSVDLSTDTLIAHIRIRAGATSIQDSDITYLVGTPYSPFVSGIVTDQTDYRISQMFARLLAAEDEADEEIQQWIDDNTTEFEEWFARIKQSLSGDVATTLANRLDELQEVIYDITPVVNLVSKLGGKRIIPDYTGASSQGNRTIYNVRANSSQIDPLWIKNGTMGPLRIGDIIRVWDSDDSYFVELVIVDFNYYCDDKLKEFGVDLSGQTTGLTGTEIASGYAEGKNHIVVATSGCWLLVSSVLKDVGLDFTEQTGETADMNMGRTFFDSALYTKMDNAYRFNATFNLYQTLLNRNLLMLPHIEYAYKPMHMGDTTELVFETKSVYVSPLSLSMAFGNCSIPALRGSVYAGGSNDKQLAYFANYPDPFGRFFVAKDYGSTARNAALLANKFTSYWLKDGPADNFFYTWYAYSNSYGGIVHPRVCRGDTTFTDSSVISVMAIGGYA